MEEIADPFELFDNRFFWAFLFVQGVNNDFHLLKFDNLEAIRNYIKQKEFEKGFIEIIFDETNIIIKYRGGIKEIYQFNTDIQLELGELS